MSEIPEVDPLLIEARKVCAQVCDDLNFPPELGGGAARLRKIADGDADRYYETSLVLTALRRGMELAVERHVAMLRRNTQSTAEQVPVSNA